MHTYSSGTRLDRPASWDLPLRHVSLQLFLGAEDVGGPRGHQRAQRAQIWRCRWNPIPPLHRFHTPI